MGKARERSPTLLGRWKTRFECWGLFLAGVVEGFDPGETTPGLEIRPEGFLAKDLLQASQTLFILASLAEGQRNVHRGAEGLRGSNQPCGPLILAFCCGQRCH